MIVTHIDGLPRTSDSIKERKPTMSRIQLKNEGDGVEQQNEGDAHEHKVDPSTVGILLIHGIGQQTRGATLLQIGDSLVHWLEEQGHEPTVTCSSVVVNDDPTHFVPAHAHINHTWSNWLLAEGYWADSIIAPRFTDLLRWGVLVIPWILLTQFGRSFYRWIDFETLERDMAEPGHSPTVQIEAALRFAFSMLSVIVILFLSPLIACVLLVVLLLNVVPITAVRNLGLSIQRTISQTIGDSMVLLDSSIQRAAIYNRAYRAYEWLSRSCSRVVIIGHSQGAAIAHELVKSGRCDKTPLLVTVGSGLHKLKVVKQALAKGTYPLWIASGCVVVSVGIILGLLVWGGVEGLRTALFAAVAAVVAPALFLLVPLVFSPLLLRIRHLFEALLPTPTNYSEDLNNRRAKGKIEHWVGLVPLIPILALYAVAIWSLESHWNVKWLAIVVDVLVIFALLQVLELQASHGLIWGAVDKELPKDLLVPCRWVDIYARWDFVPNGPLAQPPSRPNAVVTFKSKPVENINSFLFDHTTYWGNVEQCITTIAAELFRLNGIGVKRAAEIERTRTVRVRTLRWCQWTLVICATILSITWWNDLDSHRATIANIVGHAPIYGASLTKMTQEAPRQILSASIVALAFIAAYYVMNILWLLWDKGACLQFARDDPNARLLSRTALFVMIAVIVLMSISLSIYWIAIH